MSLWDQRKKNKVFKEGKGIAEKLNEFCAFTSTTEEPRDYPRTKLLNREFSDPKVSVETY